MCCIIFLFVHLFAFLDVAIQLLVIVGLRLLTGCHPELPSVLKAALVPCHIHSPVWLHASSKPSVGVSDEDSFNMDSTSLCNELTLYNHLYPIIFSTFYCLEVNQRCFIYSTGKETIGNGDRNHVRESL